MILDPDKERYWGGPMVPVLLEALNWRFQFEITGVSKKSSLEGGPEGLDRKTFGFWTHVLTRALYGRAPFKS